MVKESQYSKLRCKGIFFTHTSAVVALKQLTHHPVIVDPSHATGRKEMIEPMSLAALVAGCDGLEIEVHNDPSKALSDANQQLRPEEFEILMDKVKKQYAFLQTINNSSNWLQYTPHK